MEINFADHKCFLNMDLGIISFQNKCKKCGEKYTDYWSSWCKPCQINNFKENFTSWTSENEKIDNFIQEMQLKINSSLDKVFEWIQYDQFDDIKEVGQGGFATVYSAIWKDGLLDYDKDIKILCSCNRTKNEH